MHPSFEYYLLPTIRSNRVENQSPLIQLKNQYSVLNRYQTKNHLLQFSKDLENYRLPKIIKTNIKEQENQTLHKELTKLKGQMAMKNLQNKFDMLSSMLQSKMNQNNCGGQCKYQQPQMPIIMPMPYPMMYQYQSTFPQYNENSFQNQQRRKSINSKQRSQPHSSHSQEQKNQKKKKPKKQLLKKFRKYAYAVYFCIFLKYYSVKFSKNRFQLFKENYIENNYGKKIQEQSFKIMKSLEVIDIVQIILKSPDYLQNTSSTSIGETKQNNKIVIYPKDPEKLFIKSLNFVKNYLVDLQKIILRDQFIQYYYQIIGTGSINQSFVLDDLLIPQEIQLITFSQKKGFMMVSEPTQIILLMIYMFVKQVIYNILLKLPQNRFFAKNIKKDYPGLQSSLPQILKFTEYATKVFYCICNDMYTNFIDLYHPKTNYDRLKKKFKVQPAMQLCAPGYKKRQKTIDFQQLILGIKGTDQIYLKVQQNQKYGIVCDKIQNKMRKILQILRVKVKAFNHHIYEFIRDVTLDQKYLIFQGKQVEELQRSRVQKNLQKSRQKKNLNESKYQLSNAKSSKNITKKNISSKYELRQ